MSERQNGGPSDSRKASDFRQDNHEKCRPRSALIARAHILLLLPNGRRRLLIVPKRLQSHGKIAENNPHLAVAKSQDAVAFIRDPPYATSSAGGGGVPKKKKKVCEA